MKKINLFIGLLIFSFSLGIVSCGKSSNSPVDQYVDILDEATKKAEKISSMADLMNVQSIISPEDALAIVSKNSDYVLTDSDKDKLKKSYDKLLRVAYDKTTEFGGLSDEVKKQTKAQVDLIIEAANKGIDNAKTLGDLNGIR